jgi:hypothetical protein
MASNWSIQQYLECNQNIHGKPVYNIFQRQTSILNAVTGFHEIKIPDLKGEIRTYIWVQEIVINISTPGTNLRMILIDTTYPNIQLLNLLHSGLPFPCAFDFNYLRAGKNLTLQLNSNNTFFTIGYCTISQEPIETKKNY